MKLLKFETNKTRVADVCDAAKVHDTVFIIGINDKIGYPGPTPFAFYCNRDMSVDEMIGFLERMKHEAMETFW